jgi:hypothetical protein
MRTTRNSSPLVALRGDPENRKHGRFRCGELRCRFENTGLAKVLDFSGSGMRLAATARPNAEPGDVLPLVLESPMGALATQVNVIWITKRRFRRYEMGVSFADLSPTVRASLAAIARATSDSDTVYRKVG